MQPGFIEVITYGTPPTVMPRPDGRTSGRRLALARWIGSPQNPLTARVIVNRLWQKHFGRGIVATLENFGKMGEAPTHPELLDWLAVEFMKRGWSIKQINKLMMMSDAYQMASSFERRRQLRERSGQSLPLAVPPAAARGRDRPRQHAGGRREHQSARSAESRSFRSSRKTSWPASSAGSGRPRRKGRRRGGAACMSTGAGRCRTRCSTPSTIRT